MIVTLAIFLLGAFFLSPYGLLISQFSLDLSLDMENFWWALKNTLLQAFGSGFFSVVLGVPGGLGLLWLKRQVGEQKFLWFERGLLLPNMLPSLFVIVSCLSFIEPFPYGKAGIILLHTIIHTGLVSVLFARVCLSKLGTLGHLALVEGASRWQFFKVGVLGYLRVEMVYLFVFVFVICMVSFNIPLMVGGTSGTTLEVLIYENLFIEHNWSESLTLSLVQISIVGALSLLRTPSQLGSDLRNQENLLRLAEWRWGVVFPFVCLMIIMIPLFISLPHGWQQLQAMGFDWSQSLWPAMNSLCIGVGTGLVLVAISVVACMGYEFSFWRGFLFVYLPPGAVLMGFAFFILNQWVVFPVGIQVVLGLSLMYFTALFRLSLVAPLASLLKQIEVAQVCGASTVETFKKILLPQMIRPITLVAAIGSMWACGDFAISSILSSEDFHLALIVKSLASSYRLDAAQVLMLALYLLAALAFWVWWRLGDVLGRKLNP